MCENDTNSSPRFKSAQQSKGERYDSSSGVSLWPTHSKHGVLGTLYQVRTTPGLHQTFALSSLISPI